MTYALIITAVSIIIVLILINRKVNAEFHEFEQETVEDIVNLKHQMQLYTRKTSLLEHKMKRMEDQVPTPRHIKTEVETPIKSFPDWFSKL